MFRHLIFSVSMLCWVGIPLLASVVIFFRLCCYWKDKAKEAGKPIEGKNNTTPPITYKVEVFHEPINAALSVCGFILPLLGGCLGYFALEGTNPHQLVPLLASMILLGMAIFVGLFNMFSLTAADGESLNITYKRLVYFVPQFVLQLLFTVAGILIILLYFTFAFDLHPSESAENASSERVFISRSILRVGMTKDDVLMLWGKPTTVQDSATNNDSIWQYVTPASRFMISLKENSVWNVTETKK